MGFCNENGMATHIGGEDLSVPAVAGVVSHLLGEVLAEAELILLDTGGPEELGGAAEVVAERLVRYDAIGDGLAESHGHETLVAHLSGAGVQLQLEVRNVVELGVALVVGVHKVLNLRQAELAHAEQARARGDLVTEGETNLGGGEGQLATVELQELGCAQEKQNVSDG